MKKSIILIMSFLSLLMGCTTFKHIHEVHIDPIKIEPIKVTVDVNVKIEKTFNELFVKKENPKIQKLKEIDLLVEKEDGFLKYLGSDSKEIAAVRSENERRQTIYTSITGEGKITSAQAGEYMAHKIEEYRSGRMPLIRSQIWQKQELQNLDVKGEYYAIVIGISNYKYVKKLETPVNDAVETESVLKTLYGFNTVLLKNEQATRRNILKQINIMKNKLLPDDKLLIYFAGHGENILNNTYWLPFDAKSDDDTDWIIVDTITANLKRMPAKHVLIVADSCYSGTFRTGGISFELNDSWTNYIEKNIVRKSRTVISSGGNEPVSDKGRNGHSVFSKAFIHGLKNMDKDIFTGKELTEEHLIEYVRGNANQTPEHGYIINSGHEKGDFLFIKKPDTEKKGNID